MCEVHLCVKSIYMINHLSPYLCEPETDCGANSIMRHDAGPLARTFQHNSNRQLPRQWLASQWLVWAGFKAVCSDRHKDVAAHSDEVEVSHMWGPHVCMCGTSEAYVASWHGGARVLLICCCVAILDVLQPTISLMVEYRDERCLTKEPKAVPTLNSPNKDLQEIIERHQHLCDSNILVTTLSTNVYSHYSNRFNNRQCSNCHLCWQECVRFALVNQCAKNYCFKNYDVQVISIVLFVSDYANAKQLINGNSLLAGDWQVEAGTSISSVLSS